MLDEDGAASLSTGATFEDPTRGEGETPTAPNKRGGFGKTIGWEWVDAGPQALGEADQDHRSAPADMDLGDRGDQVLAHNRARRRRLILVRNRGTRPSPDPLEIHDPETGVSVSEGTPFGGIPPSGNTSNAGCFLFPTVSETP